MRTARVVILLGVTALATASEARAQTPSAVIQGSPVVGAAHGAGPDITERRPPAPPSDRVPLEANFSRLELAALGGLVAATTALYALEAPVVEWRGAPRIGAPLDWERWVSDRLYRGAGAGRFLGGVPDEVGNLGAPVVALGFYGVDALSLLFRDRSLTGDANADHEALALIEVYALTMGLTETTKVSVGRERPLWALDRPETTTPAREASLSFFSGHTSSSFCLASFVWRDLSDSLVMGPLRASSSAVRLWLGRVAPGLILYGSAGLIGVSRIIDQQHYFTDVALGALVGTTIGNLGYALHFDAAGRPRARHRKRGVVGLVPMPGGAGVWGSF